MADRATWIPELRGLNEEQEFGLADEYDRWPCDPVAIVES